MLEGLRKEGYEDPVWKTCTNCVKKEEVEVDEKYDSDEFFSGRGTP